MSISLVHPSGILMGEINLTSSKSESNRALIIQALCEDEFKIDNLSISDDTVILQNLFKESLKKENEGADNDEVKLVGKDSDNYQQILSVGLAGTVMRFLTAFLATREGREVVLTGEHRMKERPIKVLVDVLKQLGAEIEYEENDGYPPLKIVGKELEGGKVVIDGSVSSQYISALLMIAPKLKGEIEIEFEGEVISKPYINMTMSIMKHFGALVSWDGDSIKVSPGDYIARDFIVESDWSAASYWYGMVALAKEADITLYGLQQESLQGDSVVQEIYKNLGVTTEYVEGGIRLIKSNKPITDNLAIDFIDCPDIAQTVAVTFAALNIEARFTGLKTLRIKETDRVVALQIELNKLGFNVKVEGDDLVIKKSSQALKQTPVKTYNDHRMAMAFAPLALIDKITIEDEEVVSKSYPNFWKDLEEIKINELIDSRGSE